jgi:hypothetical protein
VRLDFRLLVEMCVWKAHMSKLRDSGFHATPRIEPCLNNLKVWVCVW